MTLLAKNARRISNRQLRMIEKLILERDSVAHHSGKAVAASSNRQTNLVKLRGDGIGEMLASKASAEALEKVTVDDESTDWISSRLLGAGEAAELLKISRSTLDNWRRSHAALAFPKGVRNFVFPVAQFRGSQPLPRLAEVRSHFQSDEETWEWLVARNRMTGDAAPLERLRHGHAEEVIAAAEAALDYA